MSFSFNNTELRKMYVDKPAYSGWEKLRLREVVLTYPGLRPRKWQSQDSNSDLKTNK